MPNVDWKWFLIGAAFVMFILPWIMKMFHGGFGKKSA